MQLLKESLKERRLEDIRFWESKGLIGGKASKERQKQLFKTRKSTTLNSKHIPKNGYSYAIDIVPYPISWGDAEEKALLKAINERDAKALKTMMKEYKLVFARFYHFAGYVKGIADEMDIKIRWGGDWDSDNEFDDQTFHDLPHFEYIGD